jgi:hypothetical protein
LLGNTSSGIQLTPRVNIGTPFTTKVKREPMSSGVVSSSIVRKPTVAV